MPLADASISWGTRSPNDIDSQAQVQWHPSTAREAQSNFLETSEEMTPAAHARPRPLLLSRATWDRTILEDRAHQCHHPAVQTPSQSAPGPEAAVATLGMPATRSRVLQAADDCRKIHL